MEHQTHFGSLGAARKSRASDLAILVTSLVLGAGVSFALQAPDTLLCRLLGLAGICLLLICPELALAAYVVIGDVKGNASVASLVPVDLTLALGAVLLAGVALNLLRKRQVLSPPPIYFLFVPLVALMVASLFYAPYFPAALDKLGRFLTVTGVVIIAPFFVLNTSAALKRFLVAFGAVSFAICAWSLSNLGSSHRLVSPSDNTIGLGHVACALFVLVWLGLVAPHPFPRRTLAYPLLGVGAVALVGSASRGSVIACVLVLLASVACNRRLLLDIACLVGLAIVTGPFVGIPGASLSYLSTLVRSQTVGDLLNFRADLLEHGLRLLQQHPLLGAGLGGFRYLSPNPTLYKWPHNIFVEIACELGIPALLLVFGIFGTALSEVYRQLRDRFLPYPILTHVTAGLLLVGVVNSVNTGNINSDRSTWLFVSLVFVVRVLQLQRRTSTRAFVPSLVES